MPLIPIPTGTDGYSGGVAGLGSSVSLEVNAPGTAASADLSSHYLTQDVPGANDHRTYANK